MSLSFPLWAGDIPNGLLANDGEVRDELGRSVAVDGDRILAGAPAEDDGGDEAGAVYAFLLGNNDWSPSQKLLVHGVDFDNHFFGFSVSINETRPWSAPKAMMISGTMRVRPHFLNWMTRAYLQ